MERYAEYKDSGVDWIGQMPKHWDVLAIKRIAKLKSGSMITAENIEEYGYYPVYGGNGLRGFTSEYTHDGFYPIIGRQGALCGNVNYASGRFWASEHAVVVTPKYNNPIVWLGETLRLMDLGQYSTAAAQPGLSVETIENKRMPYPPIEEQTAIANYLDRRTTEIDGLLADLQAQADMLERYKRELIVKAVIKGLNKSTPTRDSGVEYIGAIPETWETLPLFVVAKENNVKNEGMVCDNLLSLSYGRIIPKDIDTNFGLLPASFEGYQIVHPGYTVLRLTDLQNDKRSLRTGYVTETGIITSAYMGLIPGERLDSKYFTYLLHAYDLLKIYYGLGSGLRQSLKFSDMKRLPVLLPPMPEQKTIVAYVDAKTAQINSLITDIGEQIKKLKQYRQIVIHDAVTGKIKVTEG